MSVPAIKPLWRGVVIVLAVAFTYFRVLAKLSHDWWTDENYSHGLLIPFVIGYILWVHREKLISERSEPSVLFGGALVLFGLVGVWAGIAGAELYTQRISLVILLAGIVIYFWGARLIKSLAVPFALLLLAIPIPAIIFNKIAFPLQLFASRCAVWSMRMLDIPVLRQGNVIELMPLNSATTKKLEVVEACSGIRSLMTLITLALVFAYFTDSSNRPGNSEQQTSPRWKSYGFWRSVIIVVSAVPIAILTNAMRVSGTGVLAHYYGTEVADGFFHAFSGWVVYIVAFLLLFAVGWTLDHVPVFGSRPMESKEKPEVTFAAQSVSPTTRVAKSEAND